MNKRLPYYVSLIGLITMAMPTAQAQSGIEYNTVQGVRIYAPSLKNYTEIEGSPYVPGDSLKNGWLVKDNKRITTRLRYNSYAGTVEYMQGSQILTPASSVAEFTILAADTMHFKKGFPVTGARSANDFYQLLFDGQKAKLLRYTSATIKTNTDQMASDFGKKKFQSREEYYVWVANGQAEPLAGGNMKSVVLSSKSLTSLFPQQSERINQYMSDYKLKLKSWADFASVLTYLDTP